MVDNLKAEMLPRDLFEQLRDSAARACALLKILANEDRFLILCQLTQGERNVGQLEAALGISQPTLSQQLAVLREEQLVATRKEGKYVYYTFACREAATLMETLSMLYCRRVSTPQFITHTRDLSTSSQIAEEDIKKLTAEGYRTVICLRPDSEAESFSHGSLAEKVQSAGMHFVYFPIEKGKITPSKVAQFGELINAKSGRVLVYCRGGTVSSTLYQLWVDSQPSTHFVGS